MHQFVPILHRFVVELYLCKGKHKIQAQLTILNNGIGYNPWNYNAVIRSEGFFYAFIEGTNASVKNITCTALGYIMNVGHSNYSRLHYNYYYLQLLGGYMSKSLLHNVQNA